MPRPLKLTIYNVLFIMLFACVSGLLSAANPIVPNQGLNDPHIHIFGDRAYVFASHDRSATNQSFVMDDWWVWSSPDLVHWTNECMIKPEQTYIGKLFTGCWAVDAAFRNGKYYFYFSQRNEQTGVLVGDSPAGPWHDPLGKPLLPAGIVPTSPYDNCVFQDEDGKAYIIFGVWDYYIAQLNDDMISLAEKPRLLKLDRKFGPYGDGKTDDKPNLHKANGHYYLTWGCFYAMSDQVYGPYQFKGAVMDTNTSFAPGYASPTWPKGPLQGRHGNFFTWHGQWYYTYGDLSQTGNRFYRDAFISYLHYKANGELASIRVDGIGVGEYHVPGKIEAEDFFAATNITQSEIPGGFGVSAMETGGYLIYPNVHGLTNCTQITLQFASLEATTQIEVREQGPEGPMLVRCILNKTNKPAEAQTVTTHLNHRPLVETLSIKLAGSSKAILDAFTFQP